MEYLLVFLCVLIYIGVKLFVNSLKNKNTKIVLQVIAGILLMPLIWINPESKFYPNMIITVVVLHSLYKLIKDHKSNMNLKHQRE